MNAQSHWNQRLPKQLALRDPLQELTLEHSVNIQKYVVPVQNVQS